MGSPLSGHFTAFERYLRVEAGASGHTVRNYLSDLAQWDSGFVAQGLGSASEIRTGHIRASLEARMSGRRALSAASIQRKLAALRTFLGFLTETGVVEKDVSKSVPTPRARRKLPVVLSEEQAALLAGGTARIPLSARDRALLDVLYTCGLRVSEVSNLDWSDIHWSSSRLMVRSGKGGKDRVIPVLNETKNILWELKEASPPAACPAVFRSSRGPRMSTRAIQNLVRKKALQMGIQCMRRRTPFVIPSPRIFSPTGRTCAPFKSFWVTRAFRPRSVTPISTSKRFARNTTARIRSRARKVSDRPDARRDRSSSRQGQAG
ncbi:MAG: tyrosine-type recombinase/integrase [Deltaproteobacteria bacterium]|nr:tyrosine-type recombinase/integrase [Deltaproteobacteria bacterium]